MGIIEEHEINCIYNKNEKTINLLYDYNQVESYWDDDVKKIHNEAKNNLKNIDIYINDEKIKFNTRYTSNVKGKIRVKFIFHKLLTSTSFMFYECKSLESIDLSSFNASNVTNMSRMFYGCRSLKSIDLSSFNTSNVTDMSYMFSDCSSLESIDLSSFNETNVNNMSRMFSECTSLKSIDLSSFNTTNVTNMNSMFYECSS